MTIKDVNQGGNPFLRSISTFAVAIVGLLVLKFAINMAVASYYGYNNNAITDINYMFVDSNMGKYIMFSIETVLLVGFINAIPPIVSPLIRREQLTKAALITTGGTFVMAIILQIMFQYAGIYADK